MAFRINFSRVISQANSIAEDANTLDMQIKLLAQLEQEIKVSWKGQAAEAFLNRLEILKKNIEQTKNQMNKLSSTIKYCAEKIQREDEEVNRKAMLLRSAR